MNFVVVDSRQFDTYLLIVLEILYMIIYMSELRLVFSPHSSSFNRLLIILYPEPIPHETLLQPTIDIFPYWIKMNAAQNVCNSFTKSLFEFLTNNTVKRRCAIIKRHNDNLKSCGEFSFPSNIEPWKAYIVYHTNKHRDIKTIAEFCHIYGRTFDQLKQESEKWALKIREIKLFKDRVFIYLDRVSTLSLGVENIKVSSKNILDKLSKKKNQIYDATLKENCITSLRVDILKDVTENLADILDVEVANKSIYFTFKSTDSGPANSYTVLVGTVLDSRSGMKFVDFTGEEYIKKRQTDMELIALHKYGVRVSSDERWMKFISQLGHAAAAYDLLQNKPSNTITIHLDNTGSGSSKGAAFVLYNCARIASITRKYSEGVENGRYPALPDTSEVDFTLLKDEDEWKLLFLYVVCFEPMLESCVSVEGDTYRVAPHFLCSFLASAARTFSMYYRRVKILTEARPHLLPVMWARLHLLTALRSALLSALAILNIQSVDSM